MLCSVLSREQLLEAVPEQALPYSPSTENVHVTAQHVLMRDSYST